MHVPSGSASHHTGPGEPGEATLLAALADTSDSLTAAIVTHDREAILNATLDAEAIVAELTRLEGATDPAARPRPADAGVVLLAARIEAAARRNALLLERAWATDAAILRLLATAARSEADAASGDYGAAGMTAAPDPAQPSGWLDRSA
jgi:hypothetical protein